MEQIDEAQQLRARCRAPCAPASIWCSPVVTVTSRTRPSGSRTVSGTSASSVPNKDVTHRDVGRVVGMLGERFFVERHHCWEAGARKRRRYGRRRGFRRPRPAGPTMNRTWSRRAGRPRSRRGCRAAAANCSPATCSDNKIRRAVRRTREGTPRARSPRTADSARVLNGGTAGGSRNRRVSACSILGKASCIPLSSGRFCSCRAS